MKSRRKNKNKNEQSLRGQGDIIEQTSKCVIGVPEREKIKRQKKYRYERYLNTFQIWSKTFIYTPKKLCEYLDKSFKQMKAKHEDRILKTREENTYSIQELHNKKQ